MKNSPTRSLLGESLEDRNSLGNMNSHVQLTAQSSQMPLSLKSRVRLIKMKNAPIKKDPITGRPKGLSMPKVINK